ncbi:MAG TPA: hypothetical protein VEV16_13385 [Daejeonella sp.]|nr:hypothetical protein [Daejeonella sp.]
MKTPLTPHLLGFLIERGYTYCLAKTRSTSKLSASVIITLTPVKEKPMLETLPLGYDTYFRITREPMQMACGIDDTEIYISIDLKRNRYAGDRSGSRVAEIIKQNNFAFE